MDSCKRYLFFNGHELNVGYATFLPMSNFIPKSSIPDPHNVRLQLQLNDRVVQDDNTNLMIFKIPELLEAITDVIAINEGDIILSHRSFVRETDF